MQKLNESWHVFVMLMIGFAVIAFFIHRRLKQSESIKADFGAPARGQNARYESPNDGVEITSR